MAELNQFKKTWLNEAMETLDHYNTRPFTTDFMKKYNIPIKKSMTKSSMHKKIKQKINSKKSPFFHDLVNYLDELKMYGKQHVFLYTLKRAQSDYLNKLRKSTYVKNRLKIYRLMFLYNNKRMVWNSQNPKLFEVEHSYYKEKGELVFKWVETRRFFKNVTKNPNNPPRFIIKTERSVAFFLVNLKNGNAEIRIQCLQSRSTRTLKQELETYKNEIKKFVEFHLFSPISMEPVICTLLGKSDSC